MGELFEGDCEVSDGSEGVVVHCCCGSETEGVVEVESILFMIDVICTPKNCGMGASLRVCSLGFVAGF